MKMIHVQATTADTKYASAYGVCAPHCSITCTITIHAGAAESVETFTESELGRIASRVVAILEDKAEFLKGGA